MKTYNEQSLKLYNHISTQTGQELKSTVKNDRHTQEIHATHSRGPYHCDTVTCLLIIVGALERLFSTSPENDRTRRSCNQRGRLHAVLGVPERSSSFQMDTLLHSVCTCRSSVRAAGQRSAIVDIESRNTAFDDKRVAT